MNQKDFWKTLISLKGKWKITKDGLLRYEDNSCPIVAVAKKKFPKARISKCDECKANGFLKLDWDFVNTIVDAADFGFKYESYFSDDKKHQQAIKRFTKLIK